MGAGDKPNVRRLIAQTIRERLAMPRKSSEPIAAGGLDNPSGQFREFAAECLELAQTTLSLEKRSLYLEMARVWFQMALRWEKRLQRDRPS